MNDNYERKFRTQAPAKSRTEKPRRIKLRRRLSFFEIFLMLVGAATLILLLLRHVIVPVLVMLPQWIGGSA